MVDDEVACSCDKIEEGEVLQSVSQYDSVVVDAGDAWWFLQGLLRAV